MIGLAIAYLWQRGLTTALNVALLAISVAMLVLLLQFGHQAEDRFLTDTQGIDLVVGAKGSPLQLVLSSVYHLDEPTGNIPFEGLALLREHPGVAQAIPLALGDNFAGFRIVGSEPALLDLYGAKLASGQLFARSSEVVIGAGVAAATGAGLGQRFVGSHGLGEEGEGHDEAPFEVVGILAPTRTVADRLIVTPLESVWDVHGLPHTGRAGGDHHHTRDADPEVQPEITAVLVQYRNPAAAVHLPPMINRQTSMQAASPAREGARLIGLFAAAIDAIGVFAWLLAATGGLAIFVTLYNAIQARTADLALLRVMGAGQWQVFAVVMFEGLIVAVLGSVAGIALAHGLLWGADLLYPAVAEAGISATRFYLDELLILAAVAAIGLVAALLPASGVYRGSLMPILNRA